jgi:hypothetical protein
MFINALDEFSIRDAAEEMHCRGRRARTVGIGFPVRWIDPFRRIAARAREVEDL